MAGLGTARLLRGRLWISRYDMEGIPGKKIVVGTHESWMWSNRGYSYPGRARPGR